MDYFLSSPTATSLVSSPGIEPTSTILLENDHDQETAITSPTNRSRHTKSEQQPETTVSGASTPQSHGTVQVALQEPSEVYYATTFTTNADVNLLEQSPFTADPTQTRLSASVSLLASDAGSSSSGSPLTLPAPLSEMSASSASLEEEKGEGETVDDETMGYQQTPWTPSGVITDNYDGDDSLTSFSTVSLSSTDTRTTATPTPATPARFTAEEKGKGVDRSGREWAQSVEEKSARRKSVDEKARHRRTRSTGAVMEVTKSKSAASPRERSHRRSTSDYDVRYRRRRKVIQEDGFSRDFVLLVALCVGFACAGILIVRPAVLAMNHGDGFDLYFDV